MTNYIITSLKKIKDSNNTFEEISPLMPQIAYEIFTAQTATTSKYVESTADFEDRIKAQAINILNSNLRQLLTIDTNNITLWQSLVTQLNTAIGLINDPDNITDTTNTYDIMANQETLKSQILAIWNTLPNIYPGEFPLTNTSLSRNICTDNDYNATIAWLQSLTMQSQSTNQGE